MNEFEQRSWPGGGGGDRRPRRGRRGRGGGAAPFRPSGAGAPFRPSGPPSPAPHPGREEDESTLQARELAAYERRQQQQQRRAQPWRRPGPPAMPRPMGAPLGQPQPWRQRPGGGGMRDRRAAGYQEAVRRVTAGTQRAAPSHDAGEPIAGPRAVLEAIRAGRVVRKLYVSQDRSLRTGAVNELIQEAQQRRIFINFVDKLELARVSPLEDHQGVVAIVEGRPGVDLDALLLHLDTVDGPPLVLVLDSLQDPQNFGVLLRSAEGAGADGVVIPRHRQVGLTAAVARTSAGASEHLLIADVANLRQAIDALKEKGVWVVAADDSGELAYDEVDYRGASAIVIGNEGEGIRRLVLEGCDQVVRIPMEGKVSSLNAAAAGSVILYEALRQRRHDVAPPPPKPRPERTEAEARSADGEAAPIEADEADVAVDVASAEADAELAEHLQDEREREEAIAEVVAAPADAELEDEQPPEIAAPPQKRATKRTSAPRKTTTTRPRKKKEE